MQIGVLLGCASLVTVATLVAAMSGLRVLASALALAFGVYALQKERHLQRLARLHHDECSIHLTVADSLLRSGVLRADRELLDLRIAVEVGARAHRRRRSPTRCSRTAPASGSSVRRARRRSRRCAISKKSASGSIRMPAHEALDRHEPVRRGASEGRTVIAVPLEHHCEVVGVLEVVSGPAEPYGAHDAELVSAFARGAVGGLLSGRRRVRHAVDSASCRTSKGE